MALRIATATQGAMQAAYSQAPPQLPTATDGWLTAIQNLPDSLLAGLLGDHIDSDSQLQLFKVCKTLRNLVLKNSNCTELSVDLFDKPVSDAMSALKLAGRHARNIYLHLSWGEPYGYHGHTRAQRSQALTQSCLQLLELADAEHALTAVSSLQVMGADAHTLLQPDKAHLFTQLHTLQLDHATITDSSMEVLLSLPCLTHLAVGWFKLRRSYAGRPCMWQSITCSGVDVETLTQLPLHQAAQLQVQRFGADDQDCGPLTLGLPPGTTLDTCAQAASNVVQCRGIAWDDDVAFGPDCSDMDGTVLADFLVLCLPLLVGAPGLSIHYAHLTTSIKGALSEHVSTKKRVVLEDSCTWEDEVGMQLVSCMPEDSELRVYVENEEQLTKLCCAAKRRLKLYPVVEDFWTLPIGYYDRIKAAMRQYGHQYVTIPFHTLV